MHQSRKAGTEIKLKIAGAVPKLAICWVTWTKMLLKKCNCQWRASGFKIELMEEPLAIAELGNDQI